ncbi:hypothetical protein EBZ38_07410 [bacterium]|nr:hypothetical protein [bacterium]
MNFKKYADSNYTPPVGKVDAETTVEINFTKTVGNPEYYNEGLAKVHTYLYATSTAIFDFKNYTWQDNMHQNYYAIYKHIASTLGLPPKRVELTNKATDPATRNLLKNPVLPHSSEMSENNLRIPIPDTINSRQGLLVLINRLMLIAQMGTSKAGYLTVTKRPKIIVKSSLETLARGYGHYDIFPGNDILWIKNPPILLYSLLSKKYPKTIEDTDIPAKWYDKEMAQREQYVDLSTEEEADWAV